MAFSFHTSDFFFHSLACMVSDKKSTVIHIHVSLYIMPPHPNLGFVLFSLSVFCNFNTICVGVWEEGSISLAWCLLSFLIYSGLVFILYFGKFLTIIISNISSAPFTHSSLSDILIIHVLHLLLLYHIS